MRAALVVLLLLGASQARAEDHPGLTHLAIGAGVVGSFLDVATTMYTIGQGKGYEANPVLAPIAHAPIAFGLVKGSTAVGMSLLILKVHATHPKLAQCLGWGQAAVFTVLAFQNDAIRRQ